MAVIGLVVVAAVLIRQDDRPERNGDEPGGSEVLTDPGADAEPGREPEGTTDDRPREEPTAEDERLLLLVVGDPALTGPERDLRTALQELGFAVEVMDDEASSAEAATDKDVVVISKTVQSAEIADTFLQTRTGVVFWEDNAQAIEQGVRGLATIDLVNPESTAWHGPGTDVYVNPDAPAELRAGLSGQVTFYREAGEMTYAPTEDGQSTTASSAIWIAEFGQAGDGRYVYYVIEADAGLADGTDSHGRRAYFGLYDETFPLLTGDGRALFEAAVEWAATGS